MYLTARGGGTFGNFMQGSYSEPHIWQSMQFNSFFDSQQKNFRSALVFGLKTEIVDKTVKKI